MAFIGFVAHYTRNDMMNLSCEKLLNIYDICQKIAEKFLTLPRIS